MDRVVNAIKEYPTLFMIGDNDEGLARGIQPWLEMVERIKARTEAVVKTKVIGGGIMHWMDARRRSLILCPNGSMT